MKKKIFVFFIIVFVINFIWEFLHYPLYNDYSNIPKNLHLIAATLGDLFFIFLIFTLISVKNKELKWFNKPKILDYAFIIAFGLIISIIIEIINLNFLHKWSYTSAMPVIFGIGISPLVQLFVTALISLEISRKI